MITLLTIKNYALIDDIRLELHSGFTTITGETGAGKSIILGALGLLLGKRADLGSVKDPSKKCIIEGTFELPQYSLQDLFSHNELDYEPTTILRREILPEGKSRAFVNDSPVSLSQMQALADYLVDVHSQHETLELLKEGFQMDVLDSLANNSILLVKYKNSLAEYKKLTDELAELKEKKIQAEKDNDYHSFLYAELKALNLSTIDQPQLEETFETLNNIEVIQESLSQIIQLFSDEQIGSLKSSKEARLSLGKIRSFSSPFEEAYERLNSAIIELEDLQDTFQNLSQKIEPDPEALMQVKEKLQELYKLQQKHSVASVDELKAIESELLIQIEGTESLVERTKALENQIQNIDLTLKEIASQISKNRTDSIPTLKDKLESNLFELGLPNARFRFDLHPSNIFRGNGMDTLEVWFTANKGLPFAPLQKVASGGEMSRIMLAIKAILSHYKKLPTIIFDEIDTGVSGEIANKMALIMEEMGKAMQVLAITHLPQVASKGNHHIKVYKGEMDEVTHTMIKVLSSEERLQEIAQMLAGKKITDAAIANARELLN